MKLRHFVLSIIILILICFISGCADRMPYYFNGKISRYPHSKLVNSMRLKSGCYAELETNDSGKNVLEYYKDHMRKTGWSIRVERESESPTFLALFKDNTGLMIDTFTPIVGGKTRIALFMGDTDE